MERPLSLSCDEADPSPSRQVELLQELGVRHIDLRSAWGADIVEMDQGRAALQRYSAALSSPSSVSLRALGKKTPLHDFPVVDRELARAFDLGGQFSTSCVRVFGFASSLNDGAPESALSRVIDRLGVMAASAAARGVLLYLECERGLVVDGPEQALAVLQAVNSPSLRLSGIRGT